VSPTTAWVLIGALLGLRITLAVLSWQPGWSALGWDDFAHVAHASGFAAQPELAHQLVAAPPAGLTAPSSWCSGPAPTTRCHHGGRQHDPDDLAAIAGWSARRLFHRYRG
jgi:hypothetical protein